MKNHEALKKAN